MAEATHQDAGFSQQTIERVTHPGYLGSLDTVNGVVSEFVSEISADLATLDPSVSMDEHIQRHTLICRRYAGRWAGKDPAYIPMPYQQNPAYLRYLLDQANIEAKTVEDGVYCLFVQMLQNVYSITDRLASGQLTDDIGKWQLDGMMEYVATALMGLDLSEYHDV